MQTEKDLLKQCTDTLDILESQGKLKYWRDNHSLWNKAGFPDLLIFRPVKHGELGPYLQVFLIELKSPTGKGKLSKAQKEFQDFINQNKSVYCSYNVVDSYDRFIELLGIDLEVC